MKISAQPRKKLALLLFGVSKSKYIHFSKDVRDKFSQNGDFEVDYKYSVVNYRERIFKYFNKLGYDIDIYFATNNLSAEDRSELLATYPAVDYHFEETDNNHILSSGNTEDIKYSILGDEQLLELTQNNPAHYVGRNAKVRKVCELCLKSKIEYDLVLMTRFDLVFMKDFESISFDFNKINLVSMLHKPHLMCDNFYLMKGGKDFLHFTDWLHRFNLKRSSHDFLKYLKRYWEINFFANEHLKIPGLSFYKIVRNGHIEHQGTIKKLTKHTCQLEKN